MGSGVWQTQSEEDSLKPVKHCSVNTLKLYPVKAIRKHIKELGMAP